MTFRFEDGDTFDVDVEDYHGNLKKSKNFAKKYAKSFLNLQKSLKQSITIFKHIGFFRHGETIYLMPDRRFFSPVGRSSGVPMEHDGG